MSNYNHKEIEKKWQKRWEESGIYKDYGKKKKFYALDMFPYPSGAGLHVGHPKGYIATDVVSRFKMLQGFSVLHPMGWDAFGLPTENYAIKNKIHPRIATEENIATFKKQLEMFGFTYDWDREVNTTDPEYYKWTQWIFLKMFEKGLAFESEEPVNWCPSCKTVLSNEDLEGGVCERCGTEVIQKKMRQWVLKMTDYADRLLYDLDTENLDWEDSIVEQQKNWIGRSEGAQIKFSIFNFQFSINVFTTRIDTIFGCTYVVVAPEHEVIQKLEAKIENLEEVKEYLEKAQKKTILERTELQKEKTGVELKGVKAINSFTAEEVPVFVGDYVLGGYGTGAVMAVPAHDERDFEFAKKYGLEIKTVVGGEGKIPLTPFVKGGEEKAFTDDGVLVDSGEFTGLTSAEAREKMTQWLEKKEMGKRKINYKMRDWVFSRQRYWGEPIPIVHCAHCGTVGVPEEELPVRLPEVESYEPTGTGESPLANISDWVNTKCPKCGGPAKRETNTMPQWAGSCWYYLRYIDPKNDKALVAKEKEEKWMPVDLYVGGAEHATRHLLYARFWHKFLYDIGVVSTKEPFKKLVHVGLILAEDGRKMSKRWNNVVNPDEVIEQAGADSMRVYEMFMGPFIQNIAWSTQGVIGAKRFLEKVWKLSEKELQECDGNHELCKTTPIELKQMLHKTIKKVTEDIEDFRFNTAISQMMIFVNLLSKYEKFPKKMLFKFLVLLAPFAPHIAEELYAKITRSNPPNPLYQGGSIFKEEWPKYNPAMIKDETVSLVVQVSGKARDVISVPAEISEEEAREAALGSEKVKKWLEGKEIVKTIFVKGKLINLVIR